MSHNIQIKLFWEDRPTKQRYNKFIIPERWCRNGEICNYINSAKGTATPTSASDCFGPRGLKPEGNKEGREKKKKRMPLRYNLEVTLT